MVSQETIDFISSIGGRLEKVTLDMCAISLQLQPEEIDTLVEIASEIKEFLKEARYNLRENK